MNIRTLSLNVLLLWSGMFLSVSATAVFSPGHEAPYEASDGYTRMIRMLDKRSPDPILAGALFGLLNLS